MTDLTETPAAAPVADRSTRRAALIATLVAVPVTAVVAALVLAKLSPPEPAAAPAPTASAARAQATGPVEMPAPALAARPAVVCRALVSQLPATVRDLAQRPVTAGPEQNAAYGDPALTVACGGPAAQFPSTDEVWRVNGVCWHPVEAKDAPTVLTTVDREVPVTLTVPRAYDGALQWAAPVSEAVVAAVPSAKTVPSGCAG
ncbi:DUF3515 family protein [Micromonospora siamensis]|uniref:DUF3515 family protein n=1 Tax=Micromonospora siamensis TaxID=299152 RepID=UPI000B5AF066|nr:DUF3515 family protein [Micromonospora siamensis]